MQGQTLHRMMNKMARRQKVLNSHRYAGDWRGSAQREEAFTAEKAFLRLDPLLSDLNKQRLDARAYHKKVVAQQGADEPMSDVAADMADSAQSAFETRLIELRDDQMLRRTAAQIMRRERRIAFRQRQRTSRLFEKKQKEFYDRMRWDHKQNMRRKAEDDFSTMMFLYWMLWFALQATQRSLSLANAFTAANVSFSPSPDPDRDSQAA